METYQTIIKAEVKKFVDKANTELGCTLPMPIIDFSNKMSKAAGKATFNRYIQLYRLTFSIPIIKLNDLNHFVSRTVPHEVAHLVQFNKYGTGDHGHGFHQIMRQLGVENSTRCHTYATPVKANGYAYKCNRCGKEIILGKVRHQRSRTNGGYKHTVCGGTMVQVG